MSPAVLALVALAAALGVSMTSRVNVGWLAIAFAWLIGVYAAGMRADAVMAGFPVVLFITLTGVTLLFAIAETNGTLAALAARALRLTRGNARMVPIVFFVIACAISSVGPGAVSTVALLIPLAMQMGTRAGVAPFLTSLMVALGANAGNLSAFSAVGVIADNAMTKAGLGGHEGLVWFANFAAHVLVGAVAYAWLVRAGSDRGQTRVRPGSDRGRSGARAGSDRGQTGVKPGSDGGQMGVRPGSDQGLTPLAPADADAVAAAAPLDHFDAHQLATLGAITLWIAGVLLLDLSLGLSAFAVSAALLVAVRSDEVAAVRRIPWGVIMMVCGVSVLIAVLEKTGGMDLFTTLLARAASPRTLNGTIAFVTGAISTYSSTSGVVLPAFLPTVPGLVERVGGGNPLAVALSINVGSSLVDVSPLSTLGALCVAAAPLDEHGSRRLFRSLLLWGLSMTIAGAILCQLFAGMLASA